MVRAEGPPRPGPAAEGGGGGRRQPRHELREASEEVGVDGRLVGAVRHHPKPVRYGRVKHEAERPGVVAAPRLPRGRSLHECVASAWALAPRQSQSGAVFIS